MGLLGNSDGCNEYVCGYSGGIISRRSILIDFGGKTANARGVINNSTKPVEEVRVVNAGNRVCNSFRRSGFAITGVRPAGASRGAIRIISLGMGNSVMNTCKNRNNNSRGLTTSFIRFLEKNGPSLTYASVFSSITNRLYICLTSGSHRRGNVPRGMGLWCGATTGGPQSAPEIVFVMVSLARRVVFCFWCEIPRPTLLPRHLLRLHLFLWTMVQVRDSTRRVYGGRVSTCRMDPLVYGDPCALPCIF